MSGFQRPADYDPNLIKQEEAAAAAAAASSASASKLSMDADDLMFEQDLGPHASAPGVDPSLFVPSSEFDALREQLKEANQARVKAEYASRKAEERIEQLASMHKSTQSILARRHKVQLKGMRTELDETKAMLTADESQLAALRRAAEGTPEAGDAAVLALKETRALELRLAETAAKLEEAQQHAQACEAEASEYKRLAEQAQQAVAAAETAGAARSLELDQLLKLQAQIDAAAFERRTGLDGGDDADAPAGSSPTAAGGSAAASAQLAVSVLAELETLRRHKAEQDALIARLRAEGGGADGADAEDGGADAAANAQALADARDQINTLTQELTAMAQAMAGLQVSPGASAEVGVELAAAKAALKAAQADAAAKDEAVKKADGLLRKREEQLKLLKENAQAKLNEASGNIKKLRAEYGNIREAYQGLKTASEEKVRRLHEQMVKNRSQSAATRKKVIEAMAGQVAALKAELHDVRGVVAAMTAEQRGVAAAVVREIKAKTGAQTEYLESLKDNYEKEVKLRKKLFNQIQELKGNIRVYARARPTSTKERAELGGAAVLAFPREGEIRVDNLPKKQSHQFEFDHVFPPTTTQEEVFEEVQDLVTSVLDGYNVCIFAYGQTGSGKTHTMEGPKDNPGVNTRALDKLFAEAGEKAAQWEYGLRITLLEIYNEKIMDLLSDTQDVTLKVVQGKDGMEVLGLTQVEVTSADDVQRNLAKGKRNRHVARTDMNDYSSRSHLILSVYAAGRNKITGQESKGKLHLIDLAGSERISRSGVTGDALKEAQKINFSLSALGNVISARANKMAHIPYRNSMLTYLLQDSLEKNSKTLMFVQLSPSIESVTETLCSLRFAERVRKVELGKAGKNVGTGGGAGAVSAPVSPNDYPEDDDAGYDNGEI